MARSLLTGSCRTVSAIWHCESQLPACLDWLVWSLRLHNTTWTCRQHACNELGCSLLCRHNVSLSGSLPNRWRLPAELIVLTLSNNQLTALPQEWQLPELLQVLYLNNQPAMLSGVFCVHAAAGYALHICHW